MRISVFGTGYLGATHSACMAELGHDVIGVDVDAEKTAERSGGEAPFCEPGLNEFLERNIAVHFTTSYPRAVEFADVLFLAVGTPQNEGEFPADLPAVYGVVETLGPLLIWPSILLGKSTVHGGTAKGLADTLERLSPPDIDVEVAWNPEFWREGHAVDDTTSPDRFVIGVDGRRVLHALDVARAVYTKALDSGVPLVVTDLPTAELVKTSANAFLATKITFINAVAEIYEAAGADVTRLAGANGYDDRIGGNFLNAGIGFGGGWLPKDIRAFMARAGELGANEALTFLREVDNMNMRRRTRVVELSRAMCGGSLLRTRAAVLGAAFEPDSDDVRDSPALNIAGQIQLQGEHVRVYDPSVMENSKRVFPTDTYTASVQEAVNDTDIIFVHTEWQEVIRLHPRTLEGWVTRKLIIDERNCIDALRWASAGWEVHGVGRPATGNQQGSGT